MHLGPRATTAGTAFVVLLVYLAFLVGYRLLDQSTPPSVIPDVSTDSETVVLLDLQDVRTVNNRIESEIVVLPGQSVRDEYGALASDLTVRIDSSADFGEYEFRRGSIPTEIRKTIVATGDSEIWPFDVYTTAPLQSYVWTGAGAERKLTPSRIEVVGNLGGWRVSTSRDSGPEGGLIVTLNRARGTLAFDVGILLVLITLPAMALFVAIETVRGVKKFHPPLTTWFGTMLFAIVPLRNILPGAPPPGAWVDQAVVLWVLIALVVAMVLYVLAWWKQSD